VSRGAVFRIRRGRWFAAPRTGAAAWSVVAAAAAALLFAACEPAHEEIGVPADGDTGPEAAALRGAVATSEGVRLVEAAP